MTDETAITSVVGQFFSAFVSGADAARHVSVLRTILLPDAIVVNAAGSEPVVLTVDSFIEPRIELLSHGGLVDFREWMTSARIELFGDIAQVWCTYEKSWSADDGAHHGRGSKAIHLVRTAAGWRISSVAWDDEPAEPPTESVGPRS
ncbi:MAG TPA: DUF4440 domain-containing protein [Nocardioides sp.]|nr:DUF4440 domain-containing protein [Nocardioides sp.]